jgi:poly(A) polymerase
MLGALLMHLEPPAGRAPAGDEVEPAAPAPDEADHGRDRGRRRGAHARAHHAGSTEADQLLATLVTTSRLPRKVAERTRLALHAQKLFHEPPKKRRRRGRGLAGQPHFVDAVQLLEISVEATGEGREVLERWNAAQGGAGSSERHERDDHPRGERRHARTDGSRPVPDTANSSGATPAERPAGRRARQDRSAAEAEGLAGSVPDSEREADPDAGSLELDAEAPDDADDAADEAVPDTTEVEAGRPHGQGRGAPSEGGAGGRRRRRRRGGKRRRRRGAGHPSQGGGSGPPPAAAGGE